MQMARVVLPVFLVSLVMGGAVGAAFASSQGFAVYGLTFVSHGVPRNLTINESMVASRDPGLDNLVLRVLSGSWNFNYSRLVNSSLQLFPFVPAIPGQNFSFAYGSSHVSANLAMNGTAAVEFQGNSYQVTSFSFSAQLSSTKVTGSVSGTFSTFPSGLLYALKAQTNGTSSLAVVLQSTSLPLSAGASSSALQMASAGLGAGAIVSVVALSLGIRSRHRQKGQPETKPDYWVD
jgi:hypothetical protein